MSLVTYTCKNCGGPLNETANHITRCKYCGTAQGYEVDKTASELALVRLEKELAVVNQKISSFRRDNGAYVVDADLQNLRQRNQEERVKKYGIENFLEGIWYGSGCYLALAAVLGIIALWISNNLGLSIQIGLLIALPFIPLLIVADWAHEKKRESIQFNEMQARHKYEIASAEKSLNRNKPILQQLIQDKLRIEKEIAKHRAVVNF